MRATRRLRHGARASVVVVPLLLVVAVGPLAPSTVAASAGTGPVATAGPLAAPVATIAPRRDKPAGPLSPRLVRLAATGAPGGAAAPGGGADAIAAVTGLPARGPGSLARRDPGAILVDVRVDDTGLAQQAALGGAGATIVAVSRSRPVITVALAVSALGALAQVSGVRSVDEVLTPQSQAFCPTGTFDEGNTQLGASTARATYSVSGQGVTVGILSDSYDAMGGAPADELAAEVPGPTNPCGTTSPVSVLAEPTAGGADEGRAMAQIVHDLAPDARLAFATAFEGETAFADNIRALQAAGAGVIVDDVLYLDEPMYQDGEVARAVNDVTALGTTYFSAAGNSTVELGGRSVGSYEAPSYRPTACPGRVASMGATDCHDFDPTPGGVDPSDGLTLQAGGSALISFGWNEPQLGVHTDLDAFLLDGNGDIVAASEYDNPRVSQRPFEILFYRNSTGVPATLRLVVGRASGAQPRFKFVMNQVSGLTAVQWDGSAGGPDVVGPTAYAHNASLAAGTVAAIPYDDSATVEPYSARGPATYCFAPVDGTAPAAPFPSCRTKQVDIAATDGAANSFFGAVHAGVHRFYGTSAAAPHAAAVAALQREAQPCRTPAEVLAAQRASAVPVPGFGPDAVGAGLVAAVGAIASLAPCVGAPPSAPQTVGAVPGPRSVTVSWSAPAATGDTPISGYTVTAAPGGQQCSWSAGPLTCTLVGMTGGVPSTVTVVAANGGGPGSSSAATGPVTPWDGAGFHPLVPTRVLDSRTAVGGWGAPLAAGAPRALTVAGVAGVPVAATAVTMNVTATGSDAGSYLTTYPAGHTEPTASSLNFAPGQTIPNLVTVPIGVDGQVMVANAVGATDVVADVVGYHDDGTGPGDLFTALAPQRILDSRTGNGWAGPVAAGDLGVRTLAVVGRGGVPSGATGVVLNVTSTESDTGSFLQVWPSDAPRPTSSNLNFGAGETIANLVTVPIGADGHVLVHNEVGHTQVVADVVGYFSPGSGSRFHGLPAPTRILDDRNGTGLTGPWGPGLSRELAVTGTGIVPAGATGLVLNATATNATMGTFVTVYPEASVVPTSSNINVGALQTIANMVVTGVDGSGSIQIHNQLGRVDLVGDVIGYYAAT